MIGIFNIPSVYIDAINPVITSYALIFAAEMGDKSQLVCMTLAARHRATPVIFGAIAAFSLLNILAVIFGVGIATWLPNYLVAGLVSLLFAIFGLQSLFFFSAEEEEHIKEKSSHNLFFTTFLLITIAEFGDKTQLAVVALSSTAMPTAIWLGSTLALSSSAILGVLAGKTLLQKIPLALVHQISGLIFLILSAFAAYKTLTLLSLI